MDLFNILTYTDNNKDVLQTTPVQISRTTYHIFFVLVHI